MDSKPTVFVVDESPDAASRAAAALERGGYDPHVETRSVELDVDADAVVTEVELPDRDGLAFADDLRSRRPTLPIVVYTDAGSEAVASRAFTVGVDEYVPKERGPEPLRRAVDRAVGRDGEAGVGRRVLFDRFTDRCPFGLLVVTDAGRVDYANETAASMLGLDRDALETRRFDGPALPVTPLDEDDPPSIDRPVRRVVEDGEPVRGARFAVETTDERRVVSIDGRPLAGRDRSGAGVFAIADVTNRVERERDLERYRTIVESADDAIYALDADDEVTLANRSLSYYVDRPREAVIGADAAAVFPDAAYETGQELLEVLSRTDETNRGRYEFELEDPAGETRHLENNVTLLEDDGPVGGSVGIIRDVTRRKRQARELERRNERLDDFASIVGHDLRNPINVIDGSIAMFRETGDPDYLETVEACVDRMERLLTELLELAREDRDVADVEPVSLETAARDAWHTVDTGDASLSLGTDLGRVEADRARLCQLFENLFRNAVEHGSTSPDSQARRDAVEHGSTSHAEAGASANAGRASFSEPSVADAPEDAVEHGSTGSDSQARQNAAEHGDPGVTITVASTDEGFAVADDGPGIDPEVADRLFERGVTSAEDGTGLGLAIVQRIVDAHDWSIRLDEDADGARFVVRTG